MVKRKVKLVNISDVESFNAICSKFDCDMVFPVENIM